ncbi:hypothetical protein MBGDC06_00518 [Thermoplasmatales archaeon SCGC AB-539-C06]|nr:hypothetical protein MBGDC06_00518 [Thermoplasmatales archaeon SCGC AB-539-C06]
MIKTDGNGTEQWNKTYGGTKYDDARCVRPAMDGGYIIVGETASYASGSWDIWLLCVDANGMEIWNKTYGGEKQELSNDIRQTSDGGYIIVGHKEQSEENRWDAWLLCVDANGTEIWNKTLGGTTTDEGGSSVIQTSDSGYMITGYGDRDEDGKGDLWVVKTDSNGTIEWDKNLGNNDVDDGGVWIQQTQDNKYIVVGYTSSFGKGKNDVWLLKIKDV